MMLKLEDIIEAVDGREIKIAIAVKMVILGFKIKDICDLLGVSDSFVSKWKTIYENEGAGGLRLHYKGSPKFLTDAQRREICSHLRDIGFLFYLWIIRYNYSNTFFQRWP